MPQNSVAIHYNANTSHTSHVLYNSTQYNSYIANQEHGFVMAQRNHPAFIHPLPIPPISPVMLPIWDYSSFWWDQSNSSYPPPHSHFHPPPRAHRFSSQESVDRGIRKRK